MDQVASARDGPGLAGDPADRKTGAVERDGIVGPDPPQQVMGRPAITHVAFGVNLEKIDAKVLLKDVAGRRQATPTNTGWIVVPTR